MKRDIVLKRCLPYTPQQVWQAVADPAMLGRWFMSNDFESKLHHNFTFRKDPQPGWDGITYCEVIELDPLRKIAYTYRGRASAVKTLACANVHSDLADSAVKGVFTDLDTVLSFTLIPDCNGTCIVLKHSGFKGLKLILVSFVMGYGWKKLLRKLHTLLEQTGNEGNGKG